MISSPRSSMSAITPSEDIETSKTTDDDSESKVVPFNDDRQREGGQDGDDTAADFGAEWQRCAVTIDHLIGKIACAVTLMAVIITSSFLAATPD